MRGLPNKLAIALLAIILANCVRPKYTPQPLNIPENWRFEADESSTLCNLDWWKQFQDPVLDELIEIALVNNQDIRVAIYRVCEFFARAGIANSFLFPEVDGNAIYDRTETTLDIPEPFADFIDRTTSNYELFLSLNWELDLWSKLRSASEAAYADFLSQIEVRRGVVLTVVAAVADAYINLRKLDAQLEVSRNTLNSRIRSMDIANDRFQLGETSLLEVRQAESEVEDAAIAVLVLERDIPIQEDLLSILIGENPYQIERGVGINALNYPCTIPAGLPSELLTRRPDIAAAEDQLIASNARVWQAEALLFPDIFLTGFYGNQSDQLKNLLTSPSLMWQFGLNAFEPLFNAGRTCYQIAEAKAVRNQALANYRQKVLNAFREVNDALIACEKNRQLVAERARQIEILSDYLNLAQLRYNEGEVDYLNILDAQRTLFDAQLRQLQAQADNFSSVVLLYAAVGGGWVTEADNFASQTILSSSQ